MAIKLTALTPEEIAEITKMRESRQRQPNDLPLIVAHLLGGTNGFNFTTEYSGEEIKVIVECAVRVAVEILNQCEAIDRGAGGG